MAVRRAAHSFASRRALEHQQPFVNVSQELQYDWRAILRQIMAAAATLVTPQYIMSNMKTWLK